VKTIEAAQISRLNLEIHIEARPEVVWKALTDDISRWWPAEFYAGGAPGARRFVLEPRPGGRMFEEWKEGGLLWGNVIGVEPGRTLQVAGIAFPGWGGPNLWLGSWELQEESGSTRLRFEESAIGRTSEEGVADKDRGWRFLFDGALRAYVEGAPAPAWND
jgi:uncharacterized protein YndB with AHSA1/START domain